MFFVSRQKYWPDGVLAVEIAGGGLDYANPDMLVPKYRGEGKEYLSPIEAVEAAIDICRAWRQDGARCTVRHGHTAGFTMPFDACTFKSARAWAKKTEENMDHCAQCGELLGKERYAPFHDPDFECCSDRCCELMMEPPDIELENR